MVIALEQINFNSVGDLALKMCKESGSGECISVNAVCHFNIASRLMEELIKLGCKVYWIDIHDINCMGYSYEFVVNVMDGLITVEPAYQCNLDKDREDGYLFLGGDIVYVHEECNSKLLKFIDADEIYEFRVDNINGDLDNDDLMTCYCSESETLCKDKNGIPTGFTKTWSTTDESGISSTSTYSFYSDDLETLKAIAKEFDVNI